MTVLEQVAELVSCHFGLVVGPRQRATLAEAFHGLERRLHLDSAGVLERIQQQPGLLQDLAAKLTVGETFLFRHETQLPFIMARLRQLLDERPGTTGIRIWSAGCSCGDEPFTLAIAAHRDLEPAQRERLMILATDLSPEQIGRAQDGRVRTWSLRSTPDAIARRYLEPVEPGEYQLADEIRRLVHFECDSIQERAVRMPPGSVDLLLFRNVAIYLSSEARHRIFEQFARVLGPEGALLMSPTDPWPPRSLFNRNPGETNSVFLPATANECPSVPRSPSPRTTPTPRTTQTPKMTPTPRMAPTPKMTPSPAATEPRPSPAIPAASLLHRAQTRADRGHTSEALDLLQQAIADAPSDSRGYLLRGQLRLASEDVAAALEDFRRALFHDPEDLFARYWYALALLEAGRHGEAHRQLEVLLQAGVTTDPAAPASAAAKLDELCEAATHLREQIR